MEDVRLDVFLSASEIGLSRSRIQSLIRDGNIQVNGNLSKPSQRLKGGDKISIRVPPPSVVNMTPQDVDFSVIYEDRSLIVVSKPAGVVVHPAPGHYEGTLVHGLLKHCKDLSGIGGELRPGIVHRLDKDTSGLMVVAKNDKAHLSLASQFKNGAIRKKYAAIVHGRLKTTEGEMNLPIGRHPVKRKKMAVLPKGGRQAITRWRKTEEFDAGFSFLSILLKTGRTHQIRVHMAHMGHPLAGDLVYGYGQNWWKRNFSTGKGFSYRPERQMLHSTLLGFIHPEKDSFMEFESLLPQDMVRMLEVLRMV
jgi:23S rRNA pseudouridine1911/1915/1917 synthase